MKFARLGLPGNERPIAAGRDGRWHDLSAAEAAHAGFPHGFVGVDVERFPVIEVACRLGAPVAPIGKIVCVGLNYREHAREIGAAFPTEPIIFLKASDTVVGPDDPVLIPPGSLKTDWEIELAVLIGAEARYLESPQHAKSCIGGYMISHDVSEREFQLERGGQWDKGKNCETFNPLGPWLVTPDDVPDPQELRLRLWVNGELRQDSNTSDMIFGVEYLVWYISQFMVLHPGDVINTGTPQGVAMALVDEPYLRTGDIVELEIDGLGRQRQVLADADTAEPLHCSERTPSVL